jgi:hypothetical protein
MPNEDDAARPLQRKLDTALSGYKVLHCRFRKVGKIALKVDRAKVSPFYALESAPSHKASFFLFGIIDRNYWLRQVADCRQPSPERFQNCLTLLGRKLGKLFRKVDKEARNGQLQLKWK